MWWECHACPAGGNSPTGRDKHIENTGHKVTTMWDNRPEDDE